VPLFLLARHQAGLGRAAWIGDLSLLQRLRVTAEVFALGVPFKGSLPHRTLAIYALLACVLAAGLTVAVVLLVRRAGPREQSAAATVGVVAGAVLAIPILAAAAGHDYVLHRNVAPALPALLVGVACGLACRRAGLAGGAAAVAIAAAGTLLTVVSIVSTSTQRPDLRGVSERLGRPDRARALVFVPRWGQLVDFYQPGVEPLPAGGERVSEVDAFAAAATIPHGVVPPAFRLVAIEHAGQFTIFRYRSAEPLAVTPGELEARLFPDSKRLPVAVLQRGP
jgi:hypothetical protein